MVDLMIWYILFFFHVILSVYYNSNTSNDLSRFIGITGYPPSALKEVVQRSGVPIDTVLTYCRSTIMDQELANYMPFFQVTMSC